MANQSDFSLAGHASMLGACVIWGLMAPIAKSAMLGGLSSFGLIAMRVSGAAVCFWLASLFLPREPITRRDFFLFLGAALTAIVFSQCQFTIGLSLTSPIDASIITTTVPIFTLVLAAVFLKEPVTWLKVLGIVCGLAGALLLITAGGHSAAGSSLGGDALILVAQFSFALYLTLFKRLIARYSVVTCMKWMFTWATCVVVPVSAATGGLAAVHQLGAMVWAEVAYVVVAGTFLAYILMVLGQKRLRPTIVSMYNYVQPIVACVASVAAGLGVFGLRQAAAVVLVFGGVWLVTHSKSRADVERQARAKTKS